MTEKVKRLSRAVLMAHAHFFGALARVGKGLASHLGWLK
jgi:hypothetical protein